MPYSSPPKNEIWTAIIFQNIIFGILFFFFENITAGTQLSYIRLHVPVVIIRFFLISDLPADNLKANKS